MADTTSNLEPHEMRITDHGKIHCFVSFALKSLQENPLRPLVLHTLPSTGEKSVPKRGANARLLEPQNTTDVSTDEPPRKKPKIATVTATIPRLVSVVEIIKREYEKWAETKRSSESTAARGSLTTGLHQYNELTTLEGLGTDDHKPDDPERLIRALEGKNFLKQKFIPHLKVTLSVNAQPELEAKGATHQPPRPIKKTRTAKARERKRKKRREAQGRT